MINRKRIKTEKTSDGLSRREREIMHALYKLGQGSAAQIREEIADPPSYTAIRTHLTILENKGHIRHEQDGPRYIYQPVAARESVGRDAIDSLLTTFFDNSVERAVAALLSRDETNLSNEELDRLAALIAEAKREGR